jgi:hypothetical protein
MLGVSTAMTGFFFMFFNILLLIGHFGMFYVPFLIGVLAICLGIWHERKKKRMEIYYVFYNRHSLFLGRFLLRR